MQNAVEWRNVMSRGQDERSQMHAMSLLLSTCEGITKRALIDDGEKWILQGSEQKHENRTAGVKALYSMLTSTPSGRAMELVKQGLSDRNGMIAFGKTRANRQDRWCGEALRRVSVPEDTFGQSGGQTVEMAEADEASEHDFVGRRRS